MVPVCAPHHAPVMATVMRVHVAGDRVILGGQAVTVMRAELA
jgi:hypothetical protein